MNNNLLQILKVAAPAAPAAPVPPPNPVSAPTVNVAAGNPGAPGTPAPRVSPSAPNGQSANFSAQPLTPTAPGAMTLHNGTYIPVEQAQMLQQQEAAAQAEAQKNAPKPEKPQQADTPLQSQLIAGWSQRLKAASDPTFLPEIQTTHGSYRGLPMMDTTGGKKPTSPQMAYNPFEQGSNMGNLYSFTKNFLTAPLRKVDQKKFWISEMNKRPSLPFNQALARNLSDPIPTGSSMNPLIQLGMNMLQGQLGADKVDSAYAAARQAFN